MTLQEFLIRLGKYLLGIFTRSDVAPEPPAPPPVPPPPAPPLPPPAPPPTPFTQSQWWHGGYALTQDYGCTDFSWEQRNPLHPECPNWHTGKDYGLPMRTPIYAGYEIYVQQKDVP